MAAVKCKNCNTLIPDGAAFCPECGAPKVIEEKATQTQQKPTQTTQTQPAQPIPQPRPETQASLRNLANSVFSKTMIMIGVCIGILLAWIGALLFTIFGLSGYQIYNILSATGFAGIGLLVFGGGFLNKDIDKYVRMGMVIVGGFIIVYGISGLTLGFSIPGFR